MYLVVYSINNIMYPQDDKQNTNKADNKIEMSLIITVLYNMN